MTLWKKISSDPLFPYFVPFLLFGIFLGLESSDPMAVYALYPIKTFVVALSIAMLWTRLPSFGPLNAGTVAFSVLVGILGIVLWVGLDPILVTRKDSSGGFNPYVMGGSSWGMQLVWGLATFRILGATLVVPIMEELFWRGFLMRALINLDDFEKVPVGTFRWFSFLATTAAFASVHGAQWPLGVVVGLLYGWWFVRTKSLGAVMIAHGVTNLLLGIYVLVSQRWYFW